MFAGNPGTPPSGEVGICRLPEELPALYWLEHWRTLRRNLKTVVLITAFGGVAGLLIALARTPFYHSVSTLEVQGITDNLMKSQDGNPNAGADPELMDLQTQIRIMQSESLIQLAIARSKIARSDRGGQANGMPAALWEAAQSLTVRAAGPTRIIEISSDSSDPRVAANFVNALAEEFIDQHIEARWQGSQRAGEKLKHTLEEMRVKLENSEDALQTSARISGLFLTAGRTSVSEEKLRLLQIDLSHAQAERITRQSQFDALVRNAGADLPALLNDPAIQALEERLTDLRRQIAEMGTTYTPDYSKVRRLRVQMAPLEAAIREKVEGTKERARNEYEESKQRESLLEEAYREQAQLVLTEAGKKIHYDALRREVDSTRALYDTMLARVKEAAIASTMRGSNVRVIDVAHAPAYPYQPRRLQLTMLGTLAGMFFGAIFVVTREQVDRTIQAPGDANLFLSLPEFGAVPSVSSAVLKPVLATAAERPPSPFSEAFRSMIASLLFTAAGDSRVLAITSAGPGEGKTTVTANLAASLVDIGKRVLVIDADLRCPRIYQILGAPNDRGLTDLLSRDSLLNLSDFAGAFRSTAKHNLTVLPPGPVGIQSPDLLYSPRLREILDYARKNFDIVLIDTPPMLQIPDARVVGRMADAVIIVLRAAKTTREAALAVRQRLTEDGTPMTGCVLNDWNPKRSPGFYGHYANAMTTVCRS